MQCVRHPGVWVWFKHPYDAKLYKNTRDNWRRLFPHPVAIREDLVRHRAYGHIHRGYSVRYPNQLTEAAQQSIMQVPSISGWVIHHVLKDPANPKSIQPCIMLASAAEAILFKLTFQV